jgi:hypothetical protein
VRELLESLYELATTEAPPRLQEISYSKARISGQRSSGDLYCEPLADTSALTS